MKNKSLVGLFAIIGPDDDVVGLVYTEDSFNAYRSKYGEWLRPQEFSVEELDSMTGYLMPVSDEFIDFYDKHVSKGKEMFEKDTYEYLRDTEF